MLDKALESGLRMLFPSEVPLPSLALHSARWGRCGDLAHSSLHPTLQGVTGTGTTMTMSYRSSYTLPLMLPLVCVSHWNIGPDFLLRSCETCKAWNQNVVVHPEDSHG